MTSADIDHIPADDIELHIVGACDNRLRTN
ncbi:protein of unknown function [Acidithiobacillus ferrivorans]|uniref:Uncharacterized protein n=1 Tax=Acidithiobacillus ferrivorans TaxID=160808 RepID=A0A060UJA5_9PROT|nr:hypothetical protein AFERRI_100020 [Acidithiobacillus ferrivorans]SMH66788.1 protein of unknown function [Acidithiobacillus ferrivorans]